MESTGKYWVPVFHLLEDNINVTIANPKWGRAVNRFQNALTVCNIALDSVVSDIFGKSATSVIDYLIEQSDNSINLEEIASRLLRSLKKKSDNVIESIEGYQMTDSQKYRIRLIRTYLDLSHL